MEGDSRSRSKSSPARGGTKSLTSSTKSPKKISVRKERPKDKRRTHTSEHLQTSASGKEDTASSTSTGTEEHQRDSIALAAPTVDTIPELSEPTVADVSPQTPRPTQQKGVGTPTTPTAKPEATTREEVLERIKELQEKKVCWKKWWRRKKGDG
jgi:hypothetical protein